MALLQIQEIKDSLDYAAPEMIMTFVMMLTQTLQANFDGTKHALVLQRLIAIRADDIDLMRNRMQEIVPEIRVIWCDRVDRSKYLTIANYAIRLQDEKLS
jgi:hypothetical protein